MAYESKASRQARVKLQLRDKNGQWIEMGGGAKWLDQKSQQPKAGTIVGFDGNYVLVAQKPANPTAEPAPMRIPIGNMETYKIKGNLDPYYKKQIDKFLGNLSGDQKAQVDARIEATNKGKKAQLDGNPEIVDVLEWGEDNDTDGVFETVTHNEFKQNKTLKFAQTNDGQKWYRNGDYVAPLEGDGEIVNTEKSSALHTFINKYVNDGSFKAATSANYYQKRLDGFKALTESMSPGDTMVDGRTNAKWTAPEPGGKWTSDTADYAWSPFIFNKDASAITVEKISGGDVEIEPEVETPLPKVTIGKYAPKGFKEVGTVAPGDLLHADEQGNPLTTIDTLANSPKNITGNIVRVVAVEDVLGKAATTKGKAVGQSITTEDADGDQKTVDLYKTPAAKNGVTGVYTYSAEDGPKADTEPKTVADMSTAEKMKLPVGTVFANGGATLTKLEGGMWSFVNHDGEKKNYPPNSLLKITSLYGDLILQDENSKADTDAPETAPEAETVESVPELQEVAVEEPEAPTKLAANKTLKGGVVFTPINELSEGDQILPINYTAAYPAKTPYAYSQLKLDSATDDQVSLGSEDEIISLGAPKKGKYFTVELPDGSNGYLGWATLVALASDNGSNKNGELEGATSAENKLSNAAFDKMSETINTTSTDEGLAVLAQSVMVDFLKPHQSVGGPTLEYSAHHKSLGDKLLKQINGQLMSIGVKPEVANFFTNLYRAKIGTLSPTVYTALDVLDKLDTPEGFSEVASKMGANSTYQSAHHEFQGTDASNYISEEHAQAAKAYFALERSGMILKALHDAANTEKAQTPTPATKAPLAEPEVASSAPIDVTGWKKISGAQGSNPGGIYEDENGQKWYVKQSQTDEHARTEVLADQFYLEAGIDAAGLRLANVGNGKLGTASPMIDGAKNDLSTKIKNKGYLSKLREGFAIDAWLANWDVLGLVMDNVVTNDLGLPVRIDPGGAMKFRAQGSLKTDLDPKFWWTRVLDWKNLRDPKIGTAHKAFNGMSDEELTESAKRVQGISPQRIDAMVDALDFPQSEATELKDILKARREDIILKAGLQEAPEALPETETAEDAPETANVALDPATAGVGAIYENSDNTVLVMKDANGQWNLFEQGSFSGNIPFSDVSEILGGADFTMREFTTFNPKDVGNYFQDVPNGSLIKMANGDDSKVLFKNAAGKFYFNGKLVPPYEILTHMDNWKADDMVYVVAPEIPPTAHTDAELDAFWPNGKPNTGTGNLDYNADLPTELSEPITVNEYVAMDDYVDNSNDINNFLRYKGSDDHIGKTAAFINGIIKKSKMKADTLVYRGIEMSDTRMEKIRAAGGMHDLGFISSTTSYATAEGFAGGAGYSKTPTIFEIQLPKGFNAHAIDYAKLDDDSYSTEEEILLPRNTTFAIVEETTYMDGKGVYFKVVPILTEDNYEGAANDSGTEPAESTGTPEADPISEVPNDGGDNELPGTEPATEGSEENTGTPSEAPAEVTVETLYPDKGKISYGANGEEFKANMKVLHEKFGPATVMTVLPSANSLKIITPAGDTYTVGAKKVTLLGDTPLEAVVVAPQAVGDKGIDPDSGKMFLVGKEMDKLFVGTNVSYTKKGETFTGTITNLFPSSKQAAVEWNDADQSKVKKVSQLVSLDEETKKPTIEEVVEDITPEVVPEPTPEPEPEPEIVGYTVDELEDFPVGVQLAYGDDTYTKVSVNSEWVYTSSDAEPQFMTVDDVEGMVTDKANITESYITPAYDEGEIDNMPVNSTLHSPLLNMTFSKDADGDWSTDDLSGYYNSYEMVNDLPDANWVYREGQPENNVSEDQLDYAPNHTELYDNNTDVSFVKDGGYWVSNESGSSYDSSELLSKFHSDEWSMNEPEFDTDDFVEYASTEYLTEQEIGAVIRHAESTHDYPETYLKIADDVWLRIDPGTHKPMTNEEWSDESLSEGWVSVDADGDGTSPIRAKTFTGNSPALIKAYLTEEVIAALPVGSKLQEKEDSTAFYVKVEDDKWQRFYKYTDSTAFGSDSQLAGAKDGFAVVWSPETAPVENEATNELDSFITGKSAKDLLDSGQLETVPTGTVFVNPSNKYTLIAKADGDEWGAYSNWTGTHYPYTFEDFTGLGTLGEWIATDPADVADRIDAYNYAKVEDSPAFPVAEGMETEATPEVPETAPVVTKTDIQEFTEEELDALPTGAVFNKTSANFKLEKLADGGWLLTHDGVGAGTHTNAAIFDDGLLGYTLDLDTVSGTPAPAQDEQIGKSTTYFAVTELENMPNGTKFYSAEKKATLTKIGQDAWNFVFDNKQSSGSFKTAYLMSEPSFVLQEKGDGTSEPDAVQDTEIGKLSSDFTEAELDAMPVGSKFIYDVNGSTLTKKANNEWQYNFANGNKGGTYTSDDVASTKQYKLIEKGATAEQAVPTAVSAPPVPSKTNISEFSEDELSTVPVGAKFVGQNGAYLIKNAKGNWDYKSNWSDSTDAYTDAELFGLGLSSFDLDKDSWTSGAAPVATPVAEAPAALKTKLSEYSMDEFSKLPVGATFKYSSKTMTKVADDEWMYKANEDHGGITYNDSTVFGMGLAYYHLDPDSVSGAETAPAAVPFPTKTALKEHSAQELDGLPVGATFLHDGGPVKIVKQSDGKWQQYSGAGSTIGYPYESQNLATIAPPKWDLDENTWPGTPAPATAVQKTKFADYTAEELAALPVGTEFDDVKDAGWAMKKVAVNEWKYGDFSHDGGKSTYSDVTAAKGNFDPMDINPSTAFVAPAEPFDGVELPKGTPLTELTLEDISKADLGTEISYMTLGKIKGVYRKVAANAWKYFPEDSKTASKYIITDEMFDHAIKGVPGSAFFVKPEEDEQVEGNVPEANPFYEPDVKWNSSNIKDLLDGYATGTVIKSNSSYGYPLYGNVSKVYYVKTEDGTWTQYKNNESKLSSKSGMNTSQIYSALPGYSGSFAVSLPKPDVDNIVTGSGELAYVGDTVFHDGEAVVIDKILKTGINVTKVADGTKLKAKAKSMLIDSEHGKAKASDNSSTPTYDFTNPLETIGKSIAAAEAAKKEVENFAGASAEEYNKAGMGIKGAVHNFDNGIAVMPKASADANDPLTGTPEPTAPVALSAYPAFQEPNPNYDKWDSSAWLKKVEQRYLDNPNKAKSSVQESNYWGKIQTVLDGEKIHIDNLLQAKYIDEDLKKEAIAGIDANQAKTDAQKAEHQKEVVAAKLEYNAKKDAYTKEFDDKYKQYTKDLEAWVKANPNPNAIDPIVMPAGSTTPFEGGEADWNKGPLGTITAVEAIKGVQSNTVLAKKGLSFAVDSDMIEDVDVNVMRILSTSGTEKLEFQFKATHAHGKVIETTLGTLGASSTSGIYRQKKVLDTVTGLLKDAGKPPGEFVGDSSKRYSITIDGAEVFLQRSTNEGDNLHTAHNNIRIVMPVNSTAEDFQKVLEKLGVDAKPPTAGSLRVMAENKILRTFMKGKEFGGNSNVTGEMRKKTLDKIKSEYDVTADDVVFGQDTNGRMKLWFTTDKAKALSAKLGMQAYAHNLTTSDNVAAVVNMVSGVNPGLLSTYHRWGHGINVSGMSSSSDMSYGSGDYLYITAYSDSKIIKNANGVIVYPEAMAARLDLWANSSDNYGKKSSEMTGAHNLLAKDNHVHEVLPKDSVPLNDIMFIRVGSHDRTQIIKQLKERGITSINGLPVDEFIVESGSPAPAYKPWAGIDAKGSIADQLAMGQVMDVVEEVTGESPAPAAV